jgi:hypothetical protein
MSEVVEFDFVLRYGESVYRKTLRVPKEVRVGEEVDEPARRLWESVQLGEAHTIEAVGTEVWREHGEERTRENVAMKLDCRYLVQAWMR